MDTVTAAQGMMALFDSYMGAHGTHGVPVYDEVKNKWEIKTTAKTHRSPVTLNMWTEHLAGRRPLGLAPVREDGTCMWASVDVDDYDDDLGGVLSLIEQRRLPLVPCRSKSGGLHLFAFMMEPIPARDVIDALADVASGLGYAGAEVFPRQAELLTERGDLPNWMVMPYYGDTYGGKLRVQAALRVSGSELGIDEFLKTANAARVSADALRGLRLPRRGTPRSRRGAVGAPRRGELFSDGPPCLQHMVAAGGFDANRNNTMMHVGVYLKKSDPEGWRSELERLNFEHCRPPLESGEVLGIIRSLEKKDYEYFCNHDPMARYCSAAVCRTRAHGVGADGDWPVLGGLSKLDSDPPIWFLDLEGVRLELSTDQLQNYGAFHRAAMDKVNRVYRLMRQDAWLRALAQVMENLVVIPAAPDVGVQAQFREVLEEFLADRRRGHTLEDVVAARPWLSEAEGVFYFRLRDLQKFMENRGQKLGRPYLMARLDKLGGKPVTREINGMTQNLWALPSGLAPPTQEAELPPAEQEQV